MATPGTGRERASHLSFAVVWGSVKLHVWLLLVQLPLRRETSADVERVRVPRGLAHKLRDSGR